MTQAVGNMRLEGREKFRRTRTADSEHGIGNGSLAVNYPVWCQQSTFGFMRLEAHAIWSVL